MCVCSINIQVCTHINMNTLGLEQTTCIALFVKRKKNERITSSPIYVLSFGKDCVAWGHLRRQHSKPFCEKLHSFDIDFARSNVLRAPLSLICLCSTTFGDNILPQRPSFPSSPLQIGSKWYQHPSIIGSSQA